jgi:hypothetical protein
MTGERIPWDQEIAEGMEEDDLDAVEFDTELAQIFADVVDVNNSLVRISVSIRNPTPYDRFLATAFTELSYFEQVDISHVAEKFPRAHREIVERLGKAISRRRQYIRYREDHHIKLARGLDMDDAETVSAGSDTQASSIPEALKDGRNSESGAGDDSMNDGQSQTSDTSYMTDAYGTETLTFPKLPPEANNGPFQCPFCYMMVDCCTVLSWRLVRSLFLWTEVSPSSHRQQNSFVELAQNDCVLLLYF